MDEIEKAIDAAYKSQITNLYKVLSQNILSANEDTQEINAAKDKFQKGLDHEKLVRTKAREAAGL